MDEKEKEKERTLTVYGGIISAAVIIAQIDARGKLFAGVSNKIFAILWGFVETALFAVGLLVGCGFLGSMFAKLFENFEEASTGAKIGKIALVIVCVFLLGELVGMLYRR